VHGRLSRIQLGAVRSGQMSAEGGGQMSNIRRPGAVCVCRNPAAHVDDIDAGRRRRLMATD